MKGNSKNPIANLACVLVLSLACLPLPAAAMEYCAKASTFRLLVAELQSVNWQLSPLSDRTISRISKRASDVRSSQLAGSLEKNGRISEKQAVIQLLNTASQISRTRQVQDPEALQEIIRAANKLIAAACIGKLGTSDTNAAITHNWNRGSGGTIYTLFNEASPLIKVSLYILALMSVIGAMLIGQAAYLYIYPLIYSRKSCRVKGLVDFGTESIQGHITVIGKKGCRFEPLDKMDLQRVSALLGSNSPQLVVLDLDLALPLNINGVSENYISIFFEVRLRQAQLAQIVERSITRPHYVKKDIMQPNLDTLMKS